MKVSVFIAQSLDGFIARPDGALDWLPGATEGEGTDPTDEQNEPEVEEHGYTEFFAGIDCLLMGRNTYEVVAGFDMDWPYSKPVYVLSSSLKESDIVEKAKNSVRLIQGEPKTVLAKIKAGGFNHIYLDGGKVIQEYLRAGLVDEMTITTIPVLIGEGIPLFGATGKDIKLEIISSKAYKSGMISSKFSVLKD